MLLLPANLLYITYPKKATVKETAKINTENKSCRIKKNGKFKPKKKCIKVQKSSKKIPKSSKKIQKNKTKKKTQRVGCKKRNTCNVFLKTGYSSQVYG